MPDFRSYYNVHIMHPISPLQVAIWVAGHLKKDIDSVMSLRRNRPITDVRYLAMKLAQDVHKFTLVEIGESFGRDYTTVLYGIGVVGGDPQLRNRYGMLKMDYVRSFEKQGL